MLDYDHMQLLGDTLTSIAWHKAGIFKHGSFAVTCAGQDADALKVLEDRAADLEVWSPKYESIGSNKR